MNYDILELTLPQQQKLLGDGMSLTCVIAWQLVCLSHTVGREVIRKIPIMPTFLIPRRELALSVNSTQDEAESEVEGKSCNEEGAGGDDMFGFSG